MAIGLPPGPRVTSPSLVWSAWGRIMGRLSTIGGFGVLGGAAGTAGRFGVVAGLFGVVAGRFGAGVVLVRGASAAGGFAGIAGGLGAGTFGRALTGGVGS